MITNQEFKNAALSALKGNWAPAVLASLVYFVIACVVSGATSIYQVVNSDMFVPGSPTPTGYLGLSGGSFLLYVFLFIPLSVGFVNAFNALYVYSNANLLSNTFGYGFKGYWRAIGGMLLMGLFTFLWSLLLLIPGIIKAYSYSLTPYILIDNPELSVREAIRKSQQMMQGQKFNLFYLQLSFIGWQILALFTGGIGFLWLLPYMQTSQAVFYQNLKDNL